jgi:Ca-activated chloride channel family protein
MLLRIFTAMFLFIQSSMAIACETALILTIDVSNSVDPGEWQLQRDGLATALQDQEVIDALVQNEAALMVVQWSGEEKQEVTIPWTRIRSALDVAQLAQVAAKMPRAFVLSDTAPAEAIYFSLAQFDDVMDCRRKVIDVSGDGTPNSGRDVATARNTAERQGVTINGIAIESMGVAITGFYLRTIVTRNGFVITARQHRDYPRAIRQKLIRELSRVLG